VTFESFETVASVRILSVLE